MEKICPIKDITFAEMRTDNILGQWGVVRSQFQGATCEPVPAIVYNRLLEKIPLSIRQEYELELEEVKLVEGSGTYTSEAEFEDEIIEPLLKQLGFQYTPQHPCLFYYGSQRHLCWVDFLVKDNGRSLTLFEDKLRILNDKELTLAVEQAKSYALMLGLPSFVVAAPEGVWVYSLNRNKEKLERKFLPNEVSSRPDEFKSLLIRLGTI